MKVQLWHACDEFSLLPSIHSFIHSLQVLQPEAFASLSLASCVRCKTKPFVFSRLIPSVAVYIFSLSSPLLVACNLTIFHTLLELLFLVEYNNYTATLSFTNLKLTEQIERNNWVNCLHWQLEREREREREIWMRLSSHPSSWSRCIK